MTNRSNKPLFWFAAGAVIAGFLTLLFGTEKGKQTRKQFSDWLRRL